MTGVAVESDSFPVTVSLDPLRTLALSTSVHQYRHEWKKDVMKLHLRNLGNQPRSNSLMLDVQLFTDLGMRTVKALVDTGATIPLVVRPGLFPQHKLRKSVWPVKLVTASGQVMPGGDTGLRMQLGFAVHNGDPDTVSRVLCDPLWCYVAEIHNNDLLIGYPFLDGFGLTVDPAAGA